MRQLVFSLFILFLFEGCSGCSKSGRFRNKKSTNKQESSISDRPNSSNIVRMIKKDGVYQIPVIVNGAQMFFIFDTGASIISISNVEASFLFKQGKLTEEDVKGTAQFIDANGDISVGTIINLKEISIGNKTLHNVEASVVNNMNAPLLMGQSALEKFGKISIDYNKGILIFE